METAKLYDALDLLGRILLSAIFLFDNIRFGTSFGDLNFLRSCFRR